MTDDFPTPEFSKRYQAQLDSVAELHDEIQRLEQGKLDAEQWANILEMAVVTWKRANDEGSIQDMKDANDVLEEVAGRILEARAADA